MTDWTDVPTAGQSNAPAGTSWTDVPSTPAAASAPAPAGPRSPWQRFSDSFVKADLNGFGGWAARRLLESTNGMGFVQRPAGMTDAQFHAALHKAVNGSQADALQSINQRDQADPVFSQQQTLSGLVAGTHPKQVSALDSAEHIGSSVVANVLGGASPAYAIAPAAGLGVLGRVAAAGLINQGQDVAMQGLKVADQTQEGFDPGEVAMAGLTGAAFQGGLEGLGVGARGLRNLKLTRAPEAKGWADIHGGGSDGGGGGTPSSTSGIEPPASAPEAAGRTVPASKQILAGGWEDVSPAAGKPEPAGPGSNVTNEGPRLDRTGNVIEPAKMPTVTPEGKLSEPFSFEQNVYDHTPEVLQHVADNLHGKSLPDAAAWMHENSTGAMQSIFGRLKDRLSDLDGMGIKGKINVGETEPGQAGEAFIEAREGDTGGQTYLSNGEEGPNFGINLRDPSLHAPNEIPGTSPGVVLHELTHAATIGLAEATRLRPNSPRLAPFVRPLKDLDALWSHVVEHSLLQEGAGKGEALPSAVRTGNLRAHPEELMAWGMSDPEVQGWLKSIPYKASTAWSAFTKGLRDLLGIKSTETTAFDALLQSFDHLTGDQEAYANAHSIFDKYGRISREARSGTPRDSGEGEEEGPEVAKSGPEKAGNINLSRLGTPEEVNQALQEAAESLKLDPVSHDQVIAKAEKLLERFTPEQLLTRNPRLFSATEYSLAVRTILAQTSRKMVGASEDVMQSLVENGQASPESLQELQRLRLLTAAAVERNSKLAGTAGRLLNQYRIALDRGGHALPPGTEEIDLEQFARLMLQFKNNPNARNGAASGSFQPHWDDYVKELWYNMRLASLDTHALLFASNAGNLGMSFLEHGTSALLGQFRRFGPSGLDRITAREVAARVYGMWRGLTSLKTYQDTVTAFSTGHPQYQQAKAPQTVTALPDWIKTPSKGIAAADQWWAGILQSSDFHGMAVRTAYREGKTGQAFWQRVQDLEQNPTRDMLTHAHDYSRVTQMMDDPTWLGKIVEKVKATPAQSAGNWERLGRFVANMIVPFPRITDGIFRTAIRYSPLGFMDRYNVADFKAGGARKDLALSRIMGGTAIMTFMGINAFNGTITGDGPSNYQKREELLATGWKPNSLKVGDTYYSYAGLGPAATQMNIIASTIEKWQAGELKDEGIVNNISNSIGAIGSNMAANDFTRDLGTAFQALQKGPEGDTARANLVGSLAQGMVTPTIVREVNQDYVDRANRDTTGDRSFGDRVKGRVESGLPGLSQNLPQKMDVFGRPETRPDTLGPRILSKIYVSPEDKDTAIQEVARLQKASPAVLIGPPTKSLKGYDAKDQPITKKLNAQEFENYQKLSGQYTLQGIHQSMQLPGWASASDEDKIAEIKSIVKDARTQARDDLFFSDPAHAREALKFSYSNPQTGWRDVK